MLRLNPRERTLLVILLILLTGIAFYKFFLQAQIAEYQTIRQEVKTQEATLDNIREKAARLNNLEKQKAKLEERLKQYQDFFTLDVRIGQILIEVEKTSRAEQVKLTGFKPQAPAKVNEHLEYPIIIEVKGEYLELCRFIGELSKLEPDVAIRGFNIVPAKEDKQMRQQPIVANSNPGVLQPGITAPELRVLSRSKLGGELLEGEITLVLTSGNLNQKLYPEKENPKATKKSDGKLSPISVTHSLPEKSDATEVKELLPGSETRN